MATGSAYTFLLALLVVIAWAATGPIFKFSSTWQLVINTGTTVVTFLMVFLIQNTQNRDGKAMQLKLDELLRSGTGRDSMIDIEDMSDEELSWIDEEFKKIHDSQDTPNEAMHKLHQKLHNAHQKRRSYSTSHLAGQMMDKINTFTGHSSDKK